VAERSPGAPGGSEDRAIPSLALALLAAALLGPAMTAPEAAAASGETRPEPFVSEEGRFRAAFPGEPVRDEGARASWAGTVREGNYELRDGEFWVRVEFHDVPRLATLVLSPETILGMAKRSLLEDVEAQDPREREASLRGHPGLAVRYEPAAHPGTVEEARLYLVRSRLYVAFARAPADAEKAAEAFLASFDVWEP